MPWVLWGGGDTWFVISVLFHPPSIPPPPPPAHVLCWSRQRVCLEDPNGPPPGLEIPVAVSSGQGGCVMSSSHRNRAGEYPGDALGDRRRAHPVLRAPLRRADSPGERGPLGRRDGSFRRTFISGGHLSDASLLREPGPLTPPSRDSSGLYSPNDLAQVFSLRGVPRAASKGLRLPVRGEANHPPTVWTGRRNTALLLLEEASEAPAAPRGDPPLSLRRGTGRNVIPPAPTGLATRTWAISGNNTACVSASQVGFPSCLPRDAFSSAAK